MCFVAITIIYSYREFTLMKGGRKEEVYEAIAYCRLAHIKIKSPLAHTKHGASALAIVIAVIVCVVSYNEGRI